MYTIRNYLYTVVNSTLKEHLCSMFDLHLMFFFSNAAFVLKCSKGKSSLYGPFHLNFCMWGSVRKMIEKVRSMLLIKLWWWCSQRADGITAQHARFSPHLCFALLPVPQQFKVTRRRRRKRREKNNVGVNANNQPVFFFKIELVRWRKKTLQTCFPMLILPTSPFSSAFSHCSDKYFGTWWETIAHDSPIRSRNSLFLRTHR